MLLIAVYYRRYGRNLPAKLNTVINSLSANHAYIWKRSLYLCLRTTWLLHCSWSWFRKKNIRKALGSLPDVERTTASKVTADLRCRIPSPSYKYRVEVDSETMWSSTQGRNRSVRVTRTESELQA